MPARRVGWLSCLLLAACSRPAPLQPVSPLPHPFDWPQWRGPDRSAVSRETGLLQSWPAEGPPLAWKAAKLGGGYSAPSIASGRVFGMSFRGSDEVVWALDEANGKELWSTRIARAKPSPQSQGSEGPHGTPTVEGDRLYVEGLNGEVACLDTATGSIHWHCNLVSDFGGKVPPWGYSESPLVDGERLICTPGGPSATLVALDVRNGRPIWKAPVPQGDMAAYSSPIVAEVSGVRQYFQFLSAGVVGVAADDGHFLWRYDRPANSVANCSTPIFAEGCVFAASSYGTGGGLARVVREGDRFRAVEVHFTRQMKNHHGGIVLVGGCLYGANDPGSLACLAIRTLNVHWEARQPGKGSIAAADGRLYYRNENGPVVLAEANPQKYVECGRFKPPDASGKNTWSNPVIANGKLYLRDQEVLQCYDVKQH